MTRLGLVFVTLVAVGCGASSSSPLPVPPAAANSPEVVKVQEIVAEQIGIAPADVAADQTFEKLGADGLDFVAIVFKTEDQLGVKISAEDLGTVTGVSDPKEMPAKLTVRQYAEFVESVKQAKPMPAPENASEAEMP
ncbi:hypothetical protein DTL42_24725 [Bremerella cremea]|uniref:Carrier domain-containing protein n=1 Tax=Bremerella cremea TaxID=1031537 RepID=A0A368KJA3_9BACT|nr:phosphopantetheine-binding protein [Bremerella cremea]RCS40579.1 hypothetical protein DTL42_24725 [Bremerella cremea]